LTYDEAAYLLKAVIDKAIATSGDPIAAAVVGADGKLLAFGAMDGVLPLSVDLAQLKAMTSAMRRLDTTELAARVPPPDPGNYGDLKLCFMPGGVVVQFEGECIGSIGVSGRKGERPHDAPETEYHDHELADYGRKKL
jgi:uncharacterized protein GlcG (DUF336 family)